jgi:glutathione S-transferase
VELYFAPLACSLASRIALYEAGPAAAHVAYVQVDTRAKRLADGRDFYALNPLGQVPVLRTESGALLSENAAILPYLAERFPEARLTPSGALEGARLREWLGFVGTELHKAVFVPLLSASAPADAKAWARELLPLRMEVLEKRLAGREHALDAFSVADAYLVTVLNWSAATGVDLGRWPVVQAYHARQHQRPSIARAFAEELALYRAQQAAPR